ncbi:uncharacterized protein LOC131317393 [Rhododendron vialii]|uniref:uncharacterized protein LOC131317393 n=1 Tax=Rhododendron vialii TaxID=182163 RepID=UPI00265E4CEE|nr:uncharacterized protein LOC131317393 [Rhododendron vialii]
MVEENPTTPLNPKNLLGGGDDKSPLGALRKPEGGHGRKVTSKGNLLTVLDSSKNREGRTATESTRRSRSRRERELIAHSRSMHNNEDILDKKRGDRHAMVEYKKAPSQRRRRRSPTPRWNRVSPQKRRSRSKSQTLEWQRTTSRKRSRSRNPSPKEEGTRKHHRDRYKRPDSDWERSTRNKMKEREEGTMSAREAARKALSNIVSSPFAKRLLEARLPSRVKHGVFILYETNTDPVAHIQHY